MRQKCLAFTLPEMMFALVLLTLLSSLALPGLKPLIEDRAGAQTVTAILDAMNLARSSAIKSGLTVTLCRSSDGASCSGQWQEGLIVFLDRNGNRQADATDRMLLTRSFENVPGKIRWRAFGNRQYLQFSATGEILYQSGNFTYCPDSGEPSQARQLIVSAIGRIRMAKDTDGDGVREDSRGRAIQC